MKAEELLKSLEDELNQYREAHANAKRVTYLPSHKEKVRELRELGIPLKRVVEAAGVSVATVMAWTKGSEDKKETKPTFKTLSVTPSVSPCLKITLPNGVRIEANTEHRKEQLIELLMWAHSLC